MADYFDVPFRIDGRGRSRLTGEDDHVRDLIYQVLFTAPGERVNRPDFGCGLRQLVFMPNSDVLATATQFLVQTSLQRWLRDVVVVHDVRIRAEEASLFVTVEYSRRTDGQRRVGRFNPAGPA
jgi:phage baseplate assembly protein W